MRPCTFRTAVASITACFLAYSGWAQYTVPYQFDGTYGLNPMGSLTVTGSIIYGMSYGGGRNFGGTIFQINTNGTSPQALHNFPSIPNDGKFPYGSLLLSGSALYGMTYQGGTNNADVIFEINTDGTGYQILHHFTGTSNRGSPSDGANPEGDLILSGSTLYGMTYAGGTNGGGMIFQISTNGMNFAPLYQFSGNDGANPQGSLVLANSVLYGTTHFGDGAGVVFQIN